MRAYMDFLSMARYVVKKCGLFMLFFFIALLFAVAVGVEARASDQADIKTKGDLDARWQPWIGSWRLISNTVNTSEGAVKEEYTLVISSGEDGKSITMKGYKNETFLSEEKVTADGRRHELTDDKCTGWYSYSWSQTGKRLLPNSETNCKGSPARTISGMSIIDDAGEWLDIQLLKSGNDKAITIRRYRNADSDAVTMGRVGANLADISRKSAGTNFSIDEIIELSAKVEPEVLEAALIEMHKPFPINSNQLLYLADSKVPSDITDLMVALSFPDKFVVESDAVSPEQKPESVGLFVGLPVDDECPYDDLILPWHWGSPSCMPYYDYWCMGWGGWPGWHYPFGRPGHGGGGGYGLDTGKLVAGHGYTRIYTVQGGQTTRYARPRNASERQEATGSSRSVFSSETSSSGTSSTSSSGSSSGSGSKYPCLTPSGYSYNCD